MASKGALQPAGAVVGGKAAVGQGVQLQSHEGVVGAPKVVVEASLQDAVIFGHASKGEASAVSDQRLDQAASRDGYRQQNRCVTAWRNPTGQQASTRIAVACGEQKLALGQVPQDFRVDRRIRHGADGKCAPRCGRGAFFLFGNRCVRVLCGLGRGCWGWIRPEIGD